MQFLETLGFLYGRDAYLFSAFAHGDQDYRPDFRQALFRSGPYSPAERAEYEALPDGAKEEVLGFETVLLHELMHQIDTLTTPMAALLHMWQVEEFIRLAPALGSLAARPTLDISAPIARSVVCVEHPVRAALGCDGHLQGIEELLADTSQLRALDGIGRDDIVPGWRDPDGAIETGYIVLFDDVFEPVTLFGSTRTMRKGGVRPVTLRSVLETHALSSCLRQILWRFRDDAALGAREMIRYLRCFYPTGAEDYRFVFDALARLFGFSDFEAALEGRAETSITLLDEIPFLAGILAWGALHSAQPTERLVYLGDCLRTSVAKQERFNAPEDLLRHLDQATGQVPAKEALEGGRQLVREQRARVPAHPRGLANHFLAMLEAVDNELTVRIDRGLGLGDPVGMPNEGNPARWLTREQVDQFGGRYRPSPAYDSWRRLRTLLLARLRPSAQKHAAISEWLAAASDR